MAKIIRITYCAKCPYCRFDSLKVRNMCYHPGQFWQIIPNNIIGISVLPDCPLEDEKEE